MMNKLTGVVTAAALFCWGAGCGDGPIEPQPAQPGSIKVWVELRGEDLDQDGYDVVVDSRQPEPVNGNAPAVLGATAGAHTVRLTGVAGNCDVSGAHPLSVVVPPGGIVDVVFTVVCAATGIRITTTTTGVDSPAQYRVLVNGTHAGFIPANGVFLVTRLTPGMHLIELAMPANCASYSPKHFVSVANRTVNPIRIEIECVAAASAVKIVYVSVGSQNVSERGRIVVANADGFSSMDLAPGQAPSWSPDGTRIVYSNSECTNDYYYGFICSGGLATVNPVTRAITTLTGGTRGTDPAWAPDASAIAFTRCCEASMSSLSVHYLYVLRFDGSAPQHLPTPGIMSVRDPAWSPDGARLAFTCVVAQGHTDICLINKDGTGFTRFARAESYDSAPAWSPDGSKIAFTREDMFATDIAVMGTAGTAPQRLTTGFDAAWSRDGTRLVFARGGGLYTVRADGTDVRQITVGNHSAPAWQP